MVQTIAPLDVPKENLLISGDSVHGESCLMPHSQYTIVQLDEGTIGMLVEEGSVAQQMLERPLIAINLVLEQARYLIEDKAYTFDELDIYQATTQKRHIPCVSDAVLVVEAEPVHNITTGACLLYVCELVHIQRQSTQTLKQRLQRLGIAAPQPTYS